MCHTKKLPDLCPICGEELVKGICIECEAEQAEEQNEKQQIIDEMFNSDL